MCFPVLGRNWIQIQLAGRRGENRAIGWRWAVRLAALSEARHVLLAKCLAGRELVVRTTA